MYTRKYVENLHTWARHSIFFLVKYMALGFIWHTWAIRVFCAIFHHQLPTGTVPTYWVLWIRIRSDPKLPTYIPELEPELLISEPDPISSNFYWLKWNENEWVQVPGTYPLVIVNFTVRTTKFTDRLYKSLLKIKICAAFCLQILLSPPYWDFRSDLESDPDPNFPEKSDPDPEK